MGKELGDDGMNVIRLEMGCPESCLMSLPARQQWLVAAGVNWHRSSGIN
jgi:hypothetical protein